MVQLSVMAGLKLSKQHARNCRLVVGILKNWRTERLEEHTYRMGKINALVSWLAMQYT